MQEKIPAKDKLTKLRDCVSTVHFLKQAKEFELLSQEEYKQIMSKLKVKTKKSADELVIG